MRSMPSASTMQRCGEPTHSRQTNSVVARSSSGKWRRPNACIPSMKPSSEPVERSSTRTPSGGRSASSCASATSAPTALRLSFAPGTTWLAPMFAIAAVAPAGEEEAGAAQRAPAEQPPQRQQQRAEEDAEDDRDALVRPLVQSRREPHADPRQRRVEHEPAVGGVVVRHEHDGARGVRVAQLGHDVPRRAMRERAAAEPEPAAAHVVVDRRRGGAAHDRRGHAGRAAPRARRRRSGARAATSSRRARAPPPRARRGSRPRGARPRATRRRAARPATRSRARTRPARGSPAL